MPFAELPKLCELYKVRPHSIAEKSGPDANLSLVDTPVYLTDQTRFSSTLAPFEQRQRPDPLLNSAILSQRESLKA